MIQAGDILYSSWGYDQTNVDWYRVADRKGKRVYLQPLAEQVTETGFMCGHSIPGGPTGQVFYREARGSEESEYVKIKPYAYAAKWDGQPKRCSWYA